jgi:hypothetical protein
MVLSLIVSRHLREIEVPVICRFYALYANQCGALLKAQCRSPTIAIRPSAGRMYRLYVLAIQHRWFPVVALDGHQ